MRDPNRLRLPPGKPAAFAEGWRACEAGRAPTDNPYHRKDAGKAQDWHNGMRARQDRGFETAHLPRKLCSDAFVF